ncbi:hypothetical protein ACFC0X_12310 [Paenibacillus chitinolyticus]|uniref:hypothetical protein n=1 Tax=Paenibacillus chitinolyticus TaxID=79263 RepID=UPI0035D69C86
MKMLKTLSISLTLTTALVGSASAFASEVTTSKESPQTVTNASNSFTTLSSDDWDVAGNRVSIDRVTLTWSSYTTYNTDVYAIGTTYGKKVSSTSSVTNDVDYVARTIFAEAINVNPRVDNAFAVAQSIRTRMGSTKTAKDIVSNTSWYNATGSTAWKWPSNSNYDPAGMEGELTQEELFANCLLLAEKLVNKNSIVLMGNTDIGSRVNFYDIKDSVPFYTGANKTGQCTASNVTSAQYYQNYKITQSVIKIGNHVYYSY